MDFSLTEEQQGLRDLTRRFATEHLRGAAAEMERSGSVPTRIERRFHELGLHGLLIPEEYGGCASPSRFLDFVVALEELAWGDAGAAVHLTAGAMAYLPIVIGGTEDQKKRFLPRFVGEAFYQGAMAATEPDSGSDLFGMKTLARHDGKGHFVVTGQKCFITNAPTASLFLVWATVDPSEGPAGIRGFLIERSTPGLNIGPPYNKLGLHSCGTAPVYLDEVRVPEENVVGGRRSGMIIQQRLFDQSKNASAAVAVGLARAAMEHAKAHSKVRRTFGRPIVRNQAVSHRLIDMMLEIEQCRLLVHRAAWLVDQGRSAHVAAAMAKISSGRLVRMVTLSAVHLLGGQGFIEDSPVPRYFRDAPVFDIWEGTGEMQHELLAARL